MTEEVKPTDALMSSSGPEALNAIESLMTPTLSPVQTSPLNYRLDSLSACCLSVSHGYLTDIEN